ncbi:caspase domain-containing protein [Amylostereum chailletii]|nr:caspase domain-containing protein [Amylostereum chailletii]
MWRGYPGNSGDYAPPQGPPSTYGQPSNAPMGFPSPDAGFQNPGYAPSYGPPPGPPGGPPPPPPRSTYPGQAANYGPPSGPPHSNFGPPPGPPPRPSNYGPPPGPPPVPSRQGYGDYAPPSGPPPRPPQESQRYGPQWQGADQQQHQMSFQYSQCTGKKKALCIGINYFKQNGELRGCINDARNIERFLGQNFGYKRDDMVILTDDQRDPRSIPTKENIIRAMQWLVTGAQPNDSLFFHYSGHGGQTKDTDGDEDDGYDEVIYPVDFKTNGHIVDDARFCLLPQCVYIYASMQMMHDIMVRPLPAGCRLTAIFDSCHSGSALDLPYIYSTEGKVKEPNLAAEAGQGLLTAVSSYARGDMGGVFSSMTGLIKTATGGNKRANERTKRTKTSPADVISWSGCKDSQTSADAVEAGTATGAMSYAFISTLSQQRQQSYQQLLTSIRGILKAKYSQKPQLSSSHPMDTNVLFIC